LQGDGAIFVKKRKAVDCLRTLYWRSLAAFGLVFNKSADAASNLRFRETRLRKSAGQI
jgi:hypothetical protein